MANFTRRERVCDVCGATHRNDRASCGPCVHAARKARGGYATVPCVGCGEGMHKSRTTAAAPLCKPCRASRRDTWKREGRPCATCGRVTARWTANRCMSCEMKNHGGICTVLTCNKPSLAKGMCSTHYSWYWRALRGEGTNGKGTWIMPKRRLSLYERDGWVCGICDLPVDRDAHYLDDMAPSLDHILPRSMGGGNESENLRTAHRVCNARRGARVEEVPDGEGVTAVRDHRGGAQAPAGPGEVWAAV